jgi:hypothetical protein
MYSGKYAVVSGVLMLMLGIGAAQAACVIGPGFEGLNTAVKGYPVPAESPVAGVELVQIEQVASWLEDPAYVFVDVRPPGFFRACRLKGSSNHEYTFAGPDGEAMYKSDRKLTKAGLEQWIEDGKTVVLFCNDAFGKKGCHRAANAAITSVCAWGLPAERIKWFARGVSGTVPVRPDLVEGPKCRPPWH